MLFFALDDLGSRCPLRQAYLIDLAFLFAISSRLF